MKKIKLLFVEDDASFAFVTKGSLELKDKYEVCLAADGMEGLEKYKSFHPDVIVSDIEMPAMNGLEMVRRIRQENSKIPILFATVRTQAQDVLEGYQLNVDNFIKKPFLPDELDAHIQAIIKRIQIMPVYEIKEIVYLGEYSFDTKLKVLTYQTSIYKLTERESKILWKLYQNKNEVLSRKELLEELWGRDDFFTSRSLDVFVTALRKYLSLDSSIEIKTIRGIGFKLIIPIH